MSVFLCLVRPDGSPIDDAVRYRYSAKREVPRVIPPRWCVSGEFAAMLGSDVPGLEPEVVTCGRWIGVGLVRLDPVEPKAAPASGGNGGSHLGRALGVLEASGITGVGRLVGDFAFVAWNRSTRQLIAARDTFGVRRLYLARRGDLLAFSTRASLLADSEQYDLEFFAEFILNRDDPSGRTAFVGVEAVRSAEVVTHSNGMFRRSQYWTPPQLNLGTNQSSQHVVEEFKALLFEAVACRLTGAPNVWSHLTGGMDSSSVVGVAQTLAYQGTVPHGLAGVVTYETTPPLGGDVEHARLVAERYRLRHEILGDWWLWKDDGAGPPLLDLPGFEQLNYVLERCLAALVHESGGQILLTGVGGDLYLRPQFTALADLLARGRVREALVAAARWAGAMRRSFWGVLAEYGLYPLLPTRARYVLAEPELQVPQWITDDFSRRYDLKRRTGSTKGYGGAWGAKALHLVQSALLTHASWVGRERIGEVNLEWRHPFFHRPLVEYGLQLPERWRVAPGADISKRVLRESMVGILPEPVRLRRGKGALRPATRDAMRRETKRISRLVARPLLGEFGCVHPAHFARAVRTPEENQRGEEYLISNALSLELWVRRRSDRWS